MTISLKSYILRKTCSFEQIAKKNCTKLKFRFMRNFRKKYFWFCTNCAKTHCISCAKIAQKFTKKNLRKRFSHFVETQSTYHHNYKFLILLNWPQRPYTKTLSSFGLEQVTRGRWSTRSIQTISLSVLLFTIPRSNKHFFDSYVLFCEESKDLTFRGLNVLIWNRFWLFDGLDICIKGPENDWNNF